jgi:S-adenosylmethionine:tRNA ribosyltransferase-isomerase
MYRASGRAKVGLQLDLAEGCLRGEILDLQPEGRVTVDLSGDGPVGDILENKGLAPVPPYIRREWGGDAQADNDRERYQTVYAERPGAIAAPTAGLHFSPELLADLERAGIHRTAVTLHVGPGTFKPVKTKDVEDHAMEDERYSVSDEAVAAINDVRDRGGRMIAVGTTTVRVLESVMAKRGFMVAGEGSTSLFIYPPYPFKIVDCLLTNFHLPRSTLLMMVSAFADRELILKAYEEAVREQYRFYSYGDCMLIL